MGTEEYILKPCFARARIVCGSDNLLKDHPWTDKKALYVHLVPYATLRTSRNNELIPNQGITAKLTRKCRKDVRKKREYWYVPGRFIDAEGNRFHGEEDLNERIVEEIIGICKGKRPIEFVGNSYTINLGDHVIRGRNCSPARGLELRSVRIGTSGRGRLVNRKGLGEA